MRIKRWIIFWLGVISILLIFIYFLRSPREFSLPPLSPVDKIVCFGDSLTSGTGAGKGEDYPSQLSRLLGLRVINAGVPGDTTSSARERLESDVVARNPDLVIILLGGNDFLRRFPLQDTQDNIEKMVSRLKEEGMAVLLVSPLGYYDKAYRKVARKYGIPFIPHLLRGIITNPQFKSDEFHPNSKGYHLIAQKIAEFIRKQSETN